MYSVKKQLVDLGLSAHIAEKIAEQVDFDLGRQSKEFCWANLTKQTQGLPFFVHWTLYKTIFPECQAIPAPAWWPSLELQSKTHIYACMQEQYCETYAQFHDWSLHQRIEFWSMMMSKLNIHFKTKYQSILDMSDGAENPHWCVGASMNIVDSCFQAEGSATAIIARNERGVTCVLTYSELEELCNRIANSMSSYVSKGDKVAIVMPMNIYAVAIYLAVIKLGGIVVAIPDSFAEEEIAVRLGIANVQMVFCQDHIYRDSKHLPLYKKIVAAGAALIVVLPEDEHLAVQLRSQDLAWTEFLVGDEHFSAAIGNPDDPINILFSSGTTGMPKAIPWTQLCPIKCASDAYLHHDVHPGDIFCWPTNLGWMMGPWLIFACLINRATIALYEGAPNNKNFGQFIQDAQVTHLGVVPTMVRSWRTSRCMEGLDWRAIKLFSSTGERSNIEDMLYLMYLAHYRPVIEYCGGTEISGAYITGTLLQPAAPGACTTPALGMDFILLDEHGNLSKRGEVAIIPPAIGLSMNLLNNDHHQVYYADMPVLPGYQCLRRHGDEIECFSNGFYRVLGRVDDTMKLGGIKISAAEIEAVLNSMDIIYETAAIAGQSDDDGPSQLWIFAVLKSGVNMAAEDLKILLQKQIKDHLNPLFKIHKVHIVSSLPRTASNKVMRRLLRDKR